MSENTRIDAAAERREQHVAALREELDGVERAGKDDRAKAIKAEIKRLESGTPKGRQASEPAEVAASSVAGQQAEVAAEAATVTAELAAAEAEVPAPTPEAPAPEVAPATEEKPAEKPAAKRGQSRRS